MKIYALRHTRPNVPEGTIYGQSDVDVCNTFEQEKNKVMQVINQFNFDKIYSSPLKRCKKLACAIKGSINEITYDNRIKELFVGDWEGLTWNEIEHLPETQLWFKNFIETPCKNGESFTDLILRVNNFINELKMKPYKNVLVVSHAGVIRSMQVIINQAKPDNIFEKKVDYGEVFTFSI